VFVQFGRSLKPTLIAAQWNHLGDFNQISGDERCFLPPSLWGRDEDYLWYSTGDAANASDLASGVLGEGTLQARYIRGAFDDKPFTLGKYEGVRIRIAIAELAANGGAPMGFYTNFRDPEARQEIVRYFGFLRRHESLYRSNRPHAEVLLMFPRARVHEGDLAAVARFKEIGKSLLNGHVLFDILPDDRVTPAVRSRYELVINAFEAQFTANNIVERLTPRVSRFEAPKTVRVSASRPASDNEITLHFVNYNRQEPRDKANRGKGIADEKPIAVSGAEAGLQLPPGFKVQRVEFLTPESDQARNVEFRQIGERLRFRVPDFLVYGVVRVQPSDAK
jgi:hypothetical protein